MKSQRFYFYKKKIPKIKESLAYQFPCKFHKVRDRFVYMHVFIQVSEVVQDIIDAAVQKAWDFFFQYCAIKKTYEIVQSQMASQEMICVVFFVGCDIFVPSNLPDWISCSVPASCNGLECCIDLPKLNKSVAIRFDVDKCRNSINLQIGKQKTKLKLTDYKIGWCSQCQGNTFWLQTEKRKWSILFDKHSSLTCSIIVSQKSSVHSLYISILYKVMSTLFTSN